MRSAEGGVRGRRREDRRAKNTGSMMSREGRPVAISRGGVAVAAGPRHPLVGPCAYDIAHFEIFSNLDPPLGETDATYDEAITCGSRSWVSSPEKMWDARIFMQPDRLS
jgi:hypothetical protein